MTVRELIDKEAERKAKEKRSYTFTDIALAWGSKADAFLAALLEQIARGNFDYLTDTYMENLREAVEQIDNTLVWIQNEQKAKEGKHRA